MTDQAPEPNPEQILTCTTCGAEESFVKTVVQPITAKDEAGNEKIARVIPGTYVCGICGADANDSAITVLKAREETA